MGNYLIEVIVFQGIFLGTYLLFLRKETFFQWNRIYLLSTILLAFVLPFIEIPLLQSQVFLPAQLQELNPVIIGAAPAGASATEATQIFSSAFWWMALYLAGIVCTLVILIRKYQEVNRFFRFKRKDDQRIITIPNSDAAFTFLNTIFLGENLDAETRGHILVHEEVHVLQRHGLDLLFFELLRILFWFNPIIYGYQRSISELHEYIADAKAVRLSEPRSYYNQLLNTAFGSQNVSFINTFFNHSLIKKRIIMLHKHSKTTAKWKYLLILPVLAGMLTYVGCSTDSGSENNQSETLEQQISDLQATIEAKGELSEKEKREIIKLATSTLSKKTGDKANISVRPTDYGGDENTNVPFAVIEEVPIYPGCEGLEGNAAKKICMSEKISNFVAENFDTSLGKKLGLTGVTKIYVQFRIDKNGEVVPMGARAPKPELEKAAMKLIQQLPKMQPGKHKGQEVGVLYALPIVFQN